MSAIIDAEYNLKCIFLLDPAGKLSNDDSRPQREHAVVVSVQKDVRSLNGRLSIVAGSIFIVFAAIAIGWAAWERGIESEFRFAIHGPSMAPTLLGDHQIAKCGACGIDWPIEISDQGTSVSCFHCGDQATVLSSSGSASVVVVQAYRPADADSSAVHDLRIGDVVAIGGEKMMRIKRIAGLPGDIVELQGASLLVNGETLRQVMGAHGDLNFPVPTLLFEMDKYRDLSRWHGDDWQRNEQRAWTAEGPGWLMYHHRSIHQLNQPSCIWDDYPYNADLSRRLHPARSLALTAKVVCEDQGRVEVVFWIDNQPVGVTCDVSGECELKVCSDDAVSVDFSAVTAETPVAIRVLKGSVQLSSLQLARQIEYRLRPHDDRSCYPMRLGNDEFFVVGDNVPVSLDSRDFGVIQERAIKGRVELLESH